MQIPQELLDRIAELEVQALIEGLEDPEMRINPSFLEKVRKFLKENKLETTPQLVVAVQQETKEIPIFDPQELLDEHMDRQTNKKG